MNPDYRPDDITVWFGGKLIGKIQGIDASRQYPEPKEPKRNPKMTLHEKQVYHQLLDKRKREEHMIEVLMRATKDTPRRIYWDYGLFNIIPLKRFHYILEKWDDKGKYNFGVCLDLGWLEDEEEA